MKIKSVIIVLLLAGAGYAAYKMMQKKDKNVVKDRGFEFEIEEEKNEE